jgi:tRNA-dihydrouridine synthase A
MNSPDRTIAVAPMMDYTDRHCRYFHRLLSPRALLYTEMLTAHALVRGDAEHLIGFDPAEHPVALQLGGSEPQMLASAARIGERRGYAEINLNVGCPSDRVQSGRFGACLMAEPQLVADCVSAMIESVDVPVTVKCRIGIDGRDDYAFLESFVSTVSLAGASVFVIHARTAFLKGLSPKENRDIPPLRYEIANRLKSDRPDLQIVLNGGLRSVAEVRQWLPHFDGVMIGRQAYHEPWLLAELNAEIGGPGEAPTERADVLAAYADYMDSMQAKGHRVPVMLRPVLGLYAGLPGARAWRRFLAEQGRQPGATGDVLRRSLQVFSRAA